MNFRLFIICFCCLVFVSLKTQAATKPSLFLGVDIQRNIVKGKDSPTYYFSSDDGTTNGYFVIPGSATRSDTNGGSIFVGTRLYNIGLRVGFTKYLSHYKSDYDSSWDVADTQVLQRKGHNTFLDSILFLDITKDVCAKFYLGVGRLKYTYNIYFTEYTPIFVADLSTTVSSAKLRPRVGLGLELMHCGNLSSEISYIVQGGNEYVNNINTLSLAIMYAIF